MHLALCFQTNQHVSEARVPFPPGWKRELPDYWGEGGEGETRILRCICVLS